MYRLFALILAAILALAACSPSGGDPTPSTSPPGFGPLDVVIDNFEFTPASLDVKVGDTVTWTNNQDTTHTVDSSVDGGWSSGVLEPGDTFSFTFTEAGSFPYHCSIHPAMIGDIQVAP
ncbi:MAG: cupredoxin family copper-binding protein [Actinomycetota bacterium]